MVETHSIPISSWRTWQKVLNEQWPAHPDRTTLREPGVPVTVRVVWEIDGETWLDGIAIRWSKREVFVRLDDRRCAILGVWVAVGDVRRA